MHIWKVLFPLYEDLGTPASHLSLSSQVGPCRPLSKRRLASYSINLELSVREITVA